MIHSVDQTLCFYGKKPRQGSCGILAQTLCENLDLQDVKRALMIYTRRGKYAPKPVDIIGFWLARKRLTAPSCRRQLTEGSEVDRP